MRKGQGQPEAEARECEGYDREESRESMQELVDNDD